MSRCSLQFCRGNETDTIKTESRARLHTAVAVQSLSRVEHFATPWTAACQASLSFTISQSLLKLMSIELVMLSKHLIFCHPFLFLSSVFPSIRVFSNKSALFIKLSEYQSFSISPANEYSGLPSFGIDWFDLLAVQGTLKSLPQPNLKTSVFQHSTFFTVQLSHLYITRLLEKPQLLLYGRFSAMCCLCFLICCLGLSQLFFQGVSVF